LGLGAAWSRNRAVLDGVDLDILKDSFDNHIANLTNPHQVSAEQAGALPITGGTILGNISLLSGLTVDGIC